MFIYVTVLAYKYVPFFRSYSYIQVLSTLLCSYHLNALAIYLKLSMTFAGCHHKMLPPVLWPLHSKELGDQAPEMPWLWCAIWPEWCPECLHLTRSLPTWRCFFSSIMFFCSASSWVGAIQMQHPFQNRLYTWNGSEIALKSTLIPMVGLWAGVEGT